MVGGFTPLSSRLQYLEEIRQTFWNKWKAVVFQKLDQSYKWRQEQRDLCVGNVVLLKDETAASSSYRIARVTCVFKSNLDSKVHRIVVRGEVKIKCYSFYSGAQAYLRD